MAGNERFFGGRHSDKMAGDAMTRLRRLSDPCFERVSNSMILLLFKKSNAENKDFQMKIGVQFTSQL